MNPIPNHTISHWFIPYYIPLPKTLVYHTRAFSTSVNPVNIRAIIDHMWLAYKLGNPDKFFIEAIVCQNIGNVMSMDKNEERTGLFNTKVIRLLQKRIGTVASSLFKDTSVFKQP